MCSLNVHYHIHKSSKLTSKLCEANLVRKLSSSLLKTCFHIPSIQSILQAVCFLGTYNKAPFKFLSFYHTMRTTEIPIPIYLIPPFLDLTVTLRL